MKALIFNIFMTTLFTLGVYQKSSADTLPVIKDDTLIIRFGDKSKMILLVDKTNDLKSLKEYDLNALVAELDSLISSGALQTNKEGRTTLKDTTITITRTSEKPAPGNTVKVKIFDDFNFSIKYDSTKSTIEIAEIKKDKDDEDEKENDKVHKEHKQHKEKSFRRTVNNINLDLGLNNYLQNGSFPEAEGENYGLNPMGSRYVAISSIQKTRIGNEKSPLHLHWGLSLNWYNFMFEENIQIKKDTDVGRVVLIDPGPKAVNKSKLTASYINIPMMLVMDFSKGSKQGFNIGFGGYTGYRLGSHSKIRYNEGGKTKRDKDFNNFYLNNWRYGITAQVGFRGVNLFANYDLNNLFANNRGPSGNNLNAISFGIRL